jgi:hypothetical protein
MQGVSLNRERGTSEAADSGKLLEYPVHLLQV